MKWQARNKELLALEILDEHRENMLESVNYAHRERMQGMKYGIFRIFLR